MDKSKEYIPPKIRGEVLHILNKVYENGKNHTNDNKTNPVIVEVDQIELLLLEMYKMGGGKIGNKRV